METFSPACSIRRDGWTAERQAAFLVMLERTGDVASSARHVGKSRQSAYAFRRRPAGAAFACDWDVALDLCLGTVETTLLESARGRPEAVYYKGKEVGTRVRYKDNALIALINRRSLRG